MTEFYTKENLARWKKRSGIYKAIILFLMTASLAAAIVMCIFVSSQNAQKLLLTIITFFTLSGWISLIILNLAFLPALREAGHFEHIMKESPLILEGEIILSPAEFQIPKSIAIRNVTLNDGESSQTLSVNARFAHHLPQNGVRVRAKTAKGYITGIEVIG